MDGLFLFYYFCLNLFYFCLKREPLGSSVLEKGVMLGVIPNSDNDT